MIKLWPFLFVTLSLNAALLRHEIFNAQKKIYSFKEVCESIGLRSLPLMVPEGVSKLDCMGTKVVLSQFCQNQFKASSQLNSLTRGYVEKSEKVVCEFAEYVNLKYRCDDKSNSLIKCRDDKKECLQMGTLFAQKLQLEYSSLIGQRELNCRFVKVGKKGD